LQLSQQQEWIYKKGFKIIDKYRLAIQLFSALIVIISILGMGFDLRNQIKQNTNSNNSHNKMLKTIRNGMITNSSRITDVNIQTADEIKNLGQTVNKLSMSINDLINGFNSYSSNIGKLQVKVSENSKSINNLQSLLLMFKKNTNMYIDKNSDRARKISVTVENNQMYNAEKREDILWYLLKEKKHAS